MFTCAKVVENLIMANGVVHDPDSGSLFVAPSSEQAVHEFAYTDNRRAPLTLKRTVPVQGLCDNLALHPHRPGVLAACHPQLLHFLLYSKGITHSHSQAYYIPSAKEGGEAEELLLVPGEVLSGLATAIMTEDGVLIGGTVHSRGLLRCHLGDEPQQAHETA
ncbi:uncharacterized protein MONBRDRAFT_10481 [Monosiga brevicollis MX1]|uniref:Cleavage/polyadenylation specificity factor A subunit N-terminal domain-containing protein n=1 Tax=Monosiga brevicollis TaxID=81824 RepID=A9V6B5_MONBE|nr:uncharacterized protein MONBRDRAFT_10481 [Monosiga brevicollis MX1]EDQ86963.1 predicted protein [Monosiga brevicollis MX1]|eukprot:XP_001748202.1 hypothetical protein [Monosiga brevicollis MX1]